jgi:uncharacterized protein YdeI (YjbR/CyaY-like superfamily)
MNPKVDLFFSKSPKWEDELIKLREIALACALFEDIKWGCPTYSFQKRNIVLLHGFKEYCAILFFKGALLQDEFGILIQQTENVQSARQLRFKNITDINKLEQIIKAYIFEAIEVEKAGLKVEMKKKEDFPAVNELLDKWKENAAFKVAFEKLTPGRQRAYLLHFSSSKQPSTRIARIEKYLPRILNGKGLTDCVCGLSKKMPSCDGSHKFLK